MFRGRFPTRSVFCLLSVLAGVWALPGCAAVGPDYTTPESKLSAGWQTAFEGGLKGDAPDPQALAEWWSTLQDPLLTDLIARGITQNLDITAAEARVRAARAQRTIAGAPLFPTLDTSAGATWRKDVIQGQPDVKRDLYSAGFDAGWELDIFGGNRRSLEAATADYEASAETLHDTLVSLTAEIALNYIELRTFQTRLSVSEKNLEAQQNSLQLATWRHEAGLSDELAVQQARYNVESTRAQQPVLRTGREQAMNRLAVLVAKPPGELDAALISPVPIPAAPKAIAIGVPAEVLRRRPDIRRSERQLAAQTARIGVAEAQLYPKLRLSGSIGIDAFSLVSPGTGQTLGMSGGPQLSWPLFAGGKLTANVEAQKALEEESLAVYRSTVLVALQEVENEMVSFAEQQKRAAALDTAVASAEAAARLAEQQYASGLSDFNQLLDAQRSLLSFQDNAVQSRGATLSSLIRLYKALGGGWNSSAELGAAGAV